jgi:hypothetical protein
MGQFIKNQRPKNLVLVSFYSKYGTRQILYRTPKPLPEVIEFTNMFTKPEVPVLYCTAHSTLKVDENS